jgi:hypothetical protein
LLDTTTFSASSAVNVSNKLDVTTRANYMIIANFNSPASNAICNLRFRENTTDKTTGYSTGRLAINFTVPNITQTGGTAQTAMRIAIYDTAASGVTVTMFVTLSNGGAAGNINFMSNDQSNNSVDYGGGYNTSCSNITGFSLIPATGTITGTVRTYGYANS